MRAELEKLDNTDLRWITWYDVYEPDRQDLAKEILEARL